MGFAGYRVGDDGSVWSRKRGGWKKRKQAMNQGYLYVFLFLNGKKVNSYVHRMVLTAFVGPCPTGMECCHGDGNRSNNALSNLRWDTRQANAADSIKHGTSNRGERNWNSKLTEEKVKLLRRRHAAIKGNKIRVPRGTYDQLASEFGVSISCVDEIVTKGKNRRWKHVSS
jgi:hypothetical protein